MTGLAGDKAWELRSLVRQIGVAGTERRAAVLHLDRLPAGLPRRQRQEFGEIAAALSAADRAQHFLLPRGALAVVWRSRGAEELRAVTQALNSLLDGLPRNTAPPLGALLTIYDLPEQSMFLLDALDERAETGPLTGEEPISLAMLPRLEAAIAQADLGPALRRRPVTMLGQDGVWRPAWERLHIGLHDLLATLCPGPVFSLDGLLGEFVQDCAAHRLLSRMTGSRAVEDGGPFCLSMSVATILSPAFAAFDQGLPARLRGGLVLGLRSADILANGAAFARARALARAGRFALLLEDGQTGLLDPGALGLDFVQLPFTGREDDLPAARDMVVLAGVDTAEQLDWAVSHGCRRITGLAAA